MALERVSDFWLRMVEDEPHRDWCRPQGSRSAMVEFKAGVTSRLVTVEG
jgi:hypothetical protein